MGLSIAFLFASHANRNAVIKIQIEKTDSTFSVDGIHSSVFIQPQASISIASPQKTSDSFISKHLENYLVISPNLKVDILFTLFKNPDINPHKRVSLLLFPFHYFW